MPPLALLLPTVALLYPNAVMVAPDLDHVAALVTHVVAPLAIVMAVVVSVAELDADTNLRRGRGCRDSANAQGTSGEHRHHQSFHNFSLREIARDCGQVDIFVSLILWYLRNAR